MTPLTYKPETGEMLIALAREAIARELGVATAPALAADGLERPGAAFVTLMLDGELHGCVGSTKATRPLAEDVCANAIAAARDARFAPLTTEELERVRMEVSVLSPLSEIIFNDEDDAVRKLVPDVDGLVLRVDALQGIFLPHVWARYPEPHRFLTELKRKSGLDADFWSPKLRLFRYTVDRYVEEAAP